jgi:hypothetical protein
MRRRAIRRHRRRHRRRAAAAANRALKPDRARRRCAHVIGGRRAGERGSDRTWIVTFLLVAFVVVARAPLAFAFPILEADDGVRLLYCAEHSGLDLWTWRHMGYVSLLTNAITALAAGAPAGVQPILYAACAGAVAALALSLFAARRFRVVVRDDRVRAGLCLMVALAPHGYARLVAAAMWMHVNFALIAALLALTPPAKGRRARVGEFALVALLTVSSPWALVAVPLRLAQVWTRPRARAFQLGIVAVAAAYALFAVASDPAGVRDPLQLAGAYARLLAQRVVAEAIVGGVAWPSLGAAVWPFALLVVAWTAHGVARLPGRPRRAAFGLTAIVLGASALAVLGREHMGMPDIWWGNRYTFVQRVCFHLLLGIVLAHRVAALGSAARRNLVAIGIGHAFALAVVSGELYRTSRRDGEKVFAFLVAAEQRLQDPPHERAPLRLRRPGEWNLELR